MSEHTGIAWREWSEEAFAEARAQNKPVLLDIGAVWCHWCHVMDEGIPGDPVHTGTYSDPEVRQLIADDYIAVKVDNDRRPDINARYNMGGWPTTAFLTPEGETLYGETYVPPDRMKELLTSIASLYKKQPEQLAKQAERIRARRKAVEAADATPGALDPDTVETVTAAIRQSFDFVYGGFGRQPKFPHPAALAFALEQFAATGDVELKTIAEKTLRGMDSGGMYDQFAGGFFRYSTTRDWSIPHYEKMLEDNAKLTAAYSLAWVVLADDQSLETVKSSHAWLLRDMCDPETGAFAGSQDADEEERYYGQPLDVRATMPTPYIDRTIYANWNALMATSLATRYMLTGETDMLDAARQTFRFLEERMVVSTLTPNPSPEDRSFLPRKRGAEGLAIHHFYVDGMAQGGPGLIADQVDFIDAGLCLYEATGEESYLDAARQAGDYLLAELEDKTNGGFFDLKPAADAIGELAAPKKEIAENSDAALVLTRLSALTGDPRYRQSAERALRVFASSYAVLGYFAASYARAVDALTKPELHVVIVGNIGRDDTQALQRVAWKAVASGKTVQTIAGGRSEFPASDDGSARAYVCIGTACLAPASTPDELRDRLFQALENREAQQAA